MVMVSKLSNFPDELSENDELKEFELSGSDCICLLQKTPFAGSDGNTDLGRFFRECQGAPSLDLFKEQGSIEDTLNAITDQIATFEMNASQFDEFLESLQDTED